ncbi:MAG: hypothetical protein LC785_11230 [Acidobacteria bacterium]|nr:hypothetical protein [Acidobacteriota bacterium]MCA1642498.1 hypothetical protein [Acidobacteriota bacterium]
MNCQKFRTEIEELGRGAALPAQAETHAAGCDSCRSFRAEGERLRALVGGLARLEAPGDFEFRLRARIARSEGAGDRPASWRGFVPGAAWLTVAGCLVLALGVFVSFRQGRTPSPQAQPAIDQIAGTKDTTPANDRQPAVTPVIDELPTASGEVKTNTSPSRVGRRVLAPRRGKFVLPREAARELASLQNVEAASETHVLDSQGMKIYVGSPIALPVSTQEAPLEALFKDTNGATRSVSVNAVTFGARGLPSRRAPVRNASYTQGVW